MAKTRAALPLCLFWATALYGQQTQRGKAPSLKPGRIEGVVLNSTTNAPLRKALVALGKPNSTARTYSAVTDAAGRFDFPTVEPGSYVVESASLAGYTYGTPRPRNPALLSRITVAEDQRVSGINVYLMPLGTISGRVTDDEGTPLSGVTVQALSNIYSLSGVKRLNVAKSVRTDDRGRYRLSGFTPGHYIVRAVQQTGPAVFGPETSHDIAELAYEPTFYPSGAELSQALPLEIAPGSEFTGSDIRLRSVPAFHIRGRVTAPFNGEVVVQPCESPAVSDYSETFTAPVRADGQFDVGGLMSGTYCLSRRVTLGLAMQNSMQPEPIRNTNYFATTVVVTSKDVDNLNVMPAPLLDIQGVIRSDGPPSGPLKYLRVSLQSERGSGTNPSMKLNDDNTFTMSGVIPDTYRVAVMGVVSGYYVRSIDYDRRDASDGAITVNQGGGTLTIRLAPDGGQLNATVQNVNGGSVEQVAVVITAVSAVGAQSERVRIQYTDEKGLAQALNLPPGDYKVFAIEDNDDDTTIAPSPEFLAEVGNKVAAVTIRPYSGAPVDLKILTADEVRRIKSKLQ